MFFFLYYICSMNNLKEFGLYIPYIYSLIYVGSQIKPTTFLLSILGLYAFVLSLLIYRDSSCRGLAEFKYIIFAFYSFGCMGAYKLIYHFKNKKYLLWSPLVYFLTIKFMEYILQCPSHANINYALRFFCQENELSFYSMS